MTREEAQATLKNIYANRDDPYFRSRPPKLMGAPSSTERAAWEERQAEVAQLRRIAGDTARAPGLTATGTPRTYDSGPSLKVPTPSVAAYDLLGESDEHRRLLIANERRDRLITDMGSDYYHPERPGNERAKQDVKVYTEIVSELTPKFNRGD